MTKPPHSKELLLDEEKIRNLMNEYCYAIDSGDYFDEFKNINEIWHFSKREIRNSITGDMTAHLKIPSLTIPSAKDKMK